MKKLLLILGLLFSVYNIGFTKIHKADFGNKLVCPLPDIDFSCVESMQAQCSGVAESDSLELVAFYNATNGDNWTDNSGWLVAPIGQWYGITLNSNGCRILEINLSDNNLEGVLIDLQLPNLSKLILYNSDAGSGGLSGDIPDFSNLPKLRYLYLGYNSLSGTIPDFSNLPILLWLNLHGNSLSGEIPDFSHLSSLTELGLSANSLSGEIPDFSNLPNLLRLHLDKNSLSGSIPDFSHLPNLDILILRSNSLSNTIPDFSHLPALRYLHLGQNNLSGSILDYSNMPILDGLILSNNNLSGTIPDFSNLPYLQRLDLRNNDLSGAIPDFSNLPHFVTLILSNNSLSGEIPDFSSLATLSELDLNYNSLSGPIPNFSNLPNLSWFNLSNNNLSGSIPNFTNLPLLEDVGSIGWIQFCPNNLQGDIPNFEFCPLLDVENIDFSCVESVQVQCPSGISESDSLELVALYNATNGANWEDNEGWLVAPVEQWRGITLTADGCHVKEIFLEEKNFEGVLIDLRLPNLTKLTLFNFDLSGATGSGLSGNIPDFANLPNLEELNLAFNLLSGSIPDFSNLPKLISLNLRANSLSGTIPDFSNLPNLTWLNLSDNELSGSIPDFSNIPKLFAFTLKKNELSGSIPDFTNLPNLWELHLNNNNLSGTIPDFTNLPNLMELILSENNLSGSIPDFSNTPNLETIDLQNNELSGTIPNFTNLPNLEYLYICPNNFHGEVPSFNFCLSLDIAKNDFSCVEPVQTQCSDVAESDCVWPGDTNKDGIANNYDLFNIGRAYNHIGISRSNGDNSWEGQLSDSWGIHFVDGIDFKHGDCNGDGVINQQDIEAIYVNYGKVSGKTATVSEAGVPLFMVMEETIIDSIEHSFSVHLGDAENIAEEAYFIAFSLRFSVADAEIRVNNPMLSFEDSWLNQAEGNIIHLDTCFHETPTEWVWDIAISRTNKQTISDFGEICKVACIMDVINIDGKTSVVDLPLQIHIENVRLLTYDNIDIPVSTIPTQATVIIDDENTPTNLPETLMTPQISFFPNPIQANQNLMIDYPNGTDPIHITLYNITGQQLSQQTINSSNKYQLYVPQLTTGTYFVHIWDEQQQQHFVEKLIVY